MTADGQSFRSRGDAKAHAANLNDKQILNVKAGTRALRGLKNFHGCECSAFGDGTKLNALDPAVVQKLDAGRYLFFVTRERGRAAAI